jgi:hypothetical protein
MLALFSKYVFVDVDGLSIDEFVTRKWARAHLGKPSYQQRGVSEVHEALSY